MHYLGGKARLGKKIAEVVMSRWDGSQGYLEPFCGACWVTQHINTPERVCSDSNIPLISMWKALQAGWEPPEKVTEEEYKKLQAGGGAEALRAFVGFGCSFSGKWFGGFARDNSGRNYCKNAKNSVLRKLLHLRDVRFECNNYKNLAPEEMLVYCDPPYAETTEYDYSKKFDSEEFWEVMREWSICNTVLISEYTAPKDFQEVASFPTKTDIRTKAGKEPRIEKVFIRR